MRNFLNSIISGLVAGVIFAVIVIVGGILLKNVILPISYERASSLWKDMGFSSYFTIIGINIMIGLLTGMFYNVIKRGLPKNWLIGGFIYGIILWAIGRVPVIGSAYISIKIPGSILIGWLMVSLVLSIVGCIFLTLTFSVLTKGGKARKALAENERIRKKEEVEKENKSDEEGEDKGKYITA
jgi:hypothetical protein